MKNAAAASPPQSLLLLQSFSDTESLRTPYVFNFINTSSNNKGIIISKKKTTIPSATSVTTDSNGKDKEMPYYDSSVRNSRYYRTPIRSTPAGAKGENQSVSAMSLAESESRTNMYSLLDNRDGEHRDEGPNSSISINHMYRHPQDDHHQRSTHRFYHAYDDHVTTTRWNTPRRTRGKKVEEEITTTADFYDRERTITIEEGTGSEEEQSLTAPFDLENNVSPIRGDVSAARDYSPIASTSPIPIPMRRDTAWGATDERNSEPHRRRREGMPFHQVETGTDLMYFVEFAQLREESEREKENNESKNGGKEAKEDLVVSRYVTSPSLSIPFIHRLGSNPATLLGNASAKSLLVVWEAIHRDLIEKEMSYLFQQLRAKIHVNGRGDRRTNNGESTLNIDASDGVRDRRGTVASGGDGEEGHLSFSSDLLVNPNVTTQRRSGVSGRHVDGQDEIYREAHDKKKNEGVKGEEEYEESKNRIGELKDEVADERSVDSDPAPLDYSAHVVPPFPSPLPPFLSTRKINGEGSLHQDSIKISSAHDAPKGRLPNLHGAVSYHELEESERHGGTPNIDCPFPPPSSTCTDTGVASGLSAISENQPWRCETTEEPNKEGERERGTVSVSSVVEGEQASLLHALLLEKARLEEALAARNQKQQSGGGGGGVSSSPKRTAPIIFDEEEGGNGHEHDEEDRRTTTDSDESKRMPMTSNKKSLFSPPEKGDVEAAPPPTSPLFNTNNGNGGRGAPRGNGTTATTRATEVATAVLFPISAASTIVNPLDFKNSDTYTDSVSINAKEETTTNATTGESRTAEEKETTHSTPLNSCDDKNDPMSSDDFGDEPSFFITSLLRVVGAHDEKGTYHPANASSSSSHFYSAVVDDELDTFGGEFNDMDDEGDELTAEQLLEKLRAGLNKAISLQQKSKGLQSGSSAFSVIGIRQIEEQKYSLSPLRRETEEKDDKEPQQYHLHQNDRGAVYSDSIRRGYPPRQQENTAVNNFPMMGKNVNVNAMSSYLKDLASAGEESKSLGEEHRVPRPPAPTSVQHPLSKGKVILNETGWE